MCVWRKKKLIRLCKIHSCACAVINKVCYSRILGLGLAQCTTWAITEH